VQTDVSLAAKKPQRIASGLSRRIHIRITAEEVVVNAGQFIQWQDLFALVDDGSIPITRYATMESAIREQVKTYPQGIACLVILPPDARPPPDDIKRHVKSMLMRLSSAISCLAYVIEGTGFKGVAARATLVGMKIFSSRPYPIYVETSLQEAIGKVISHLANGHATTVESILKVINDERLQWRPTSSNRPRDSELTAK
jgi:hypothetical protein